MPIYDRPVRSLIHDMIGELAPKPAVEFTREDALAWFRQRYPKVNEKTVGATLIRLTTNLPSRLHYGASSMGEDDVLFQPERGRYRRYDPVVDPSPIRAETASVSANVQKRLLAAVEQHYPAWSGFDDPRFLNDEVAYRRHAVDIAAERLNAEELAQLLEKKAYIYIIDALKVVAKRGRNLLWMRMPDTSDLRILTAADPDLPRFCEALFDLLHGEGESRDRLARYLAYVNGAGLPSTWAFPTYFLFVCHPDSELLVKPESMRRFLNLLDHRVVVKDAPDADTYEALLRMAGEVRAAFEEFDPGDMIDIQSLMWVCAAGPDEAMKMDPKRIEKRQAAEQRARDVIKRHLGRFDESILREFLREINTDWNGSHAIYNRFGVAFTGALVKAVRDQIDVLNIWTERLWRAADVELDPILDEFWGSNVVKGVGRGFVTLLLYLKDPEQYAIWLPALDDGLAMLISYPIRTARTAAEYRRYNDAVLALRADLDLAPQAVDYVLALAEKKARETGESVMNDVDDLKLSNGTASTDTARLFETWYPDPTHRRFVSTTLADAVELAGTLSPRNWALTCRKDRNMIRLNVGMIEAMVARKGEVQLLLLASALSPEERALAADAMTFSRDEYRSMPEEVASGYVSVEWAMEHYDRLRRAHRAFIERASAIRAGQSAWARHHRPELVEYLRTFAVGSLNDPEYHFDTSPAPADAVNPVHTIEEIAGRTGLAADRLERWIGAINRKKQAIIYGPPGTGKTFIAKRLAEHLIGGGDGVSETVQFHPAYSYEDFMQGIRPRLTPGGELDYVMMRGRFLEFCHKAEGCEGLCVMIIDEINRANLARVMGELMYLLEYRDESIPLAGGDRFRIPDNVRIIGTMNTADRSIALVDHALRRRFAFIELRPELDVLLRYHEREETGFPAPRLVEALRQLNEAINDPHYAIGISYFLRRDLANSIEDIWRMEIEPYLAEYFYDQRDKLKSFAWDVVGRRLREE